MVSVPISADVASVKAAMDEIRTAVEKTGTAARELAKVDLSHPELQRFGADLDVVNRRLETLVKLGRGEAAAAVRSFYTPGAGVNMFGPGGLLNGGLQARYPNPADANRVQTQIGRYVFQGTQFQPPSAASAPAGPGSSPPSPPPPPAPPGLGSLFSGAAGGAMSIMGPVLGMIGIGSLGAMANSAFQAALKQDAAIDTLVRRINASGADFDKLRNAIGAASAGLGITTMEATRLATVWSRMTADAAPEAVAAGARLGGGFGRAYGLEPEQGVAALGRAQFLGEDPRQFALLIGEAVSKGGQTGQADQVTTAFMRALETTTRNMVTGASIQAGFEGFASTYTALNATGQPGLRGQNAASIIDTMNTSLMQGGNAGMASQLFTTRAFSAQGIRDPYQIQDINERGMFATLPNGRTVLQTQLAELGREYGNLAETQPYRYRHIVERQFGVRMPVVEALQHAFGNNLAGLSGSGIGMGETFKRLSANGIDLNSPQFNPTAIQDLVGIAGGNDLEGYRKRLLGRNVLSKDETKELQGASGEELMNVLLKDYAKHGQDETEGSKSRQAMADLRNALEKLGEQLVPPLTDLAHWISEMIKWLQEWNNKLQPVADMVNKANEWVGNAGASAGNWVKNAIPFHLEPSAVGGFNRPMMTFGQSAPALSDALQKERTAQAIRYFQTKEGGAFPRAAALGLAAGGLAESGWNTKAVGSAGEKGIFQWKGDRAQLIEKHFGKDILDMTFEEQLAAHAWELTQGNEKAAGDLVRAAPNPFAAGYIDTTADERPSFSGAVGFKRGMSAHRLDQQFPEGGAAESVVRIHPLEVIHRSESGAVLGTQTLPTMVDPAHPTNAPSATAHTTPSNTQPAPRPQARDNMLFQARPAPGPGPLGLLGLGA